MTKKQKKELKSWLIYLHLINMHDTEITTEGLILIHQLNVKYPQFKNIKEENQKWLEVIDND